MAIGSGLAAQLMAKKEVTYGTAVTVDKAYEFGQESLKLDKNYIMSRGLRAGRSFQSSSRRVATTKDVNGAVNLEVPTQGFGFWLDLLHGNTVTPVIQGATPAYLQTHSIGTTDATKSATIQVGRPDTGGVVRAFTYSGCMVTGWSLSCAVNEFLASQFTLDGQNETTATALATASYPSGLRSFNFTQGVLTVNGSTAANVASATVNGGLSRKVDRHFFGSNGLKNKPIQNDYATAAGSLSAEFSDLTLYNLFTGGTIGSVVLEFTGAVISGAFNERLKVTMAACGFDGETPTVDGPDVLGQDVPFMALDNGTDAPVVVEYVSTDVAAL